MPETGSITLRILTLFLSEYSHHGTVKTIRAAARKVIPNMSRLKTVSTPERVVYSHEKRIKGQAISLSRHEPVASLATFQLRRQSHWMPVVSQA